MPRFRSGWGGAPWQAVKGNNFSSHIHIYTCMCTHAYLSYVYCFFRSLAPSLCTYVEVGIYVCIYVYNFQTNVQKALATLNTPTPVPTKAAILFSALQKPCVNNYERQAPSSPRHQNRYSPDFAAHAPLKPSTSPGTPQLQGTVDAAKLEGHYPASAEGTPTQIILWPC